MVKTPEQENSQEILNHYLETTTFTDLGLYKDWVLNSIPDNIRDIGKLVRTQTIHRMVLQNGNTGSNKDLRYGNMSLVPWYHQPEDDLFPTAAAMVSELYRRDNRGLNLNRKEDNKLIVTCRYVSILMASILKAKGIPARVRSGFAPYFQVEGLPLGKSDDHWIVQYWEQNENRWVNIDVDGSLESLNFDPYDMPSDRFDFAADAYLKTRHNQVSQDYFYNAGGNSGLMVTIWELFYDFHCLMNSEMIYTQTPAVYWGRADKLTEEELLEIDELALLIQDPDKNFNKLKNIWETNKKFRLLKGGCL